MYDIYTMYIVKACHGMYTIKPAQFDPMSLITKHIVRNHNKC